MECDAVLVAIGRRPRTAGLGLDELGVARDRHGFVEVDEDFETSVPGIFAIGDCIRGPMLAHKAEEDGVAAVEIMAGLSAHVDYALVPGIVYTHPEVAAIGETEEALKERDIPYRKGVFPFSANSRARASGDVEGLVKMLAHADTDRVARRPYHWPGGRHAHPRVRLGDGFWRFGRGTSPGPATATRR